MHKETLINKIENIRTASNNGVRAPHKPLLLLYALGCYHQGRTSIPFKEAHPKLKYLLKEYGRPVKQIQTSNPFVRLKNDGIWEIAPYVNHTSNFSDQKLLRNQTHGSFTPEVLNLLDMHQDLHITIAMIILDLHFPETYHEELLEEIGLAINYGIRMFRKRNSTFRKRVLQAYEDQCAVCGFHASIHNKSIGLEAAHIKWHQAYGPDTESNGLALCSLHHRLFDKGIFTIDQDVIWISPVAKGGGMFKQMVTDFHRCKIHKPQSSLYLPNPDFTAWHVQEVFKQYEAK
ncbi:phosphorothioated DNA-binding restriction endonuclease [Halobacillus mangrovi]|uniref:Uncharacterized protein n=1 Tax=Halobacillus mangrovi TaxID=402384 RepID=A0A1W5ZQV3_9BACI|nr:HNH endonuclease [Halobacillus mangrovi]ARI75675.1 hypothetical protein HM131_02015 [Halobacillus mangrovi]